MNGRFGRPILFSALLGIMILLQPFWTQKRGALLAEDLKNDESLENPSLSLREVLDKFPFSLNGFMEMRGGMRTQNDSNQSEDASIAEARLQIEIGKFFDWAEFKFKGDFLYDHVLEEGEVDLREAYVLLSPLEFADLKVGRQILTWGTGDLIFINDLFPKDWKSFFIGRDDEYLKAPSDALKGSVFTDLMNIDIVYGPQFDPDRYIDGERLSYWSDPLDRRAGENDRVEADEPDDRFSDFELALRLSRNLGGYELAAYGYHGFWKSPAGMNPATGEALFPELSVYGASIRGSLWKGIGSVEVGYYDSRDDRKGDDPFVRNSELRFLAGYEQEVAQDFTMGIQYYLEYMMNHEDYKGTLPTGIHPRDKDRHVATLRLTKLLINQNLMLSLFVYYSPSDQDAYLRPKVHYKITDQWSAELGANVFQGAKDYTFFGQFEDNSNVYLGLRWGF